jgi:DNA polymerase-1
MVSHKRHADVQVRKAFCAAPGNTLVVADYGQLELRILAHIADCK